MTRNQSVSSRLHCECTAPGTPTVFPLFDKPGATSEGTGPFKWAPPLGANKTCLHGVNLSPKPSSKVAAFDLDGCVIESSFGKGKAKAKDDVTFKWWRPLVPKKLKQLHDEGCVRTPCTLVPY